MPRTSERGGPQTRARIASIAAGLFAEHGFDAVTVAQVAREAGVSSVTVFNHFPRKEDLYLDRSVEAEELLRDGVTARASGASVLDGLEAALLALADARHPLSGLDPRSSPFFRTVAGSPALIGRAREIAADLTGMLARTLDDDPRFDGDPGLLAALVIAGYTVVLVETARRQLVDGAAASEAEAADHRERLSALFAVLRGGAEPSDA